MSPVGLGKNPQLCGRQYKAPTYLSCYLIAANKGACTHNGGLVFFRYLTL